MAPSASLSNVGTNDVAWFWAIAPTEIAYGPILGQHPLLVMNVYRIVNGVIRQIGKSDVKHAFFSTNVGCPCPGGQVLFAGCSDTYGSGNNSDQFFFGPRPEVTAHTAGWQSLGSHFDASPIDDVRDHDGETDGFTHLLTCAEADLVTAAAQYFVEVWYIVQSDTNIFNGLGYRRFNPNLTNAAASFPYADAGVTYGSALNAWVSPTNPPANATNVIVDTGEGHFQLAATVSNLVSGSFRYRYALMNLDYDRQFRSFSLPVPVGTVVSNLTFGDIDANGANDWVGVATNGEVSQAAVSGVNSNTLDWEPLYTFSFDASAAPVGSLASLGVLEPGVASTLAVATKGMQSPSFNLQALAQDGGSLTQQWSAISGALYRMQSSTDLFAGLWFDFGGVITANGSVITVANTNPSPTQMFYRAVLQTYP